MTDEAVIKFASRAEADEMIAALQMAEVHAVGSLRAQNRIRLTAERAMGHTTSFAGP